MTTTFTVRTVLLIATLLALSGCASERFIQQNAFEVDARTETTTESTATLSPDRSIGVEAAWRRNWINGLSGPMDPLPEPSMGYGVGVFGGYSNVDGGAPYDDGNGVLNDVARTGLLFTLAWTNSADFYEESLATEFSMKWGWAFAERERREAIDVIGITRQSYMLLAPAVTVRTPVRFQLGGITTVLVAGTEAGFYTSGQDDRFRTVSVNLGLQFFDH